MEMILAVFMYHVLCKRISVRDDVTASYCDVATPTTLGLTLKLCIRIFFFFFHICISCLEDDIPGGDY